MKIIFYLIYLSTLLLSNNIVLEANQKTDIAKPLICLEGTNYDEYLNYEGYEMIQNNVNFNIPGKYQVIYENKNNERFIKNVDVISKENLNDLTYYQITSTEFDSNNTYNWEGVLYELNTNDYTYQVTSYFNPDDETSNEYLNLYYNDNLIKQTNLSTNKEIIIKKIILNNNNIYLVGMKKMNNSSYDLYVAQYTLDLEYIRDFCIFGNKYDEVKDAIIIDEYMYISGLTNSTDGYYSSNIDQDVFIFKVDYNLGIIRKSYISNIEGTETISNLVHLNDSIYYGYSYLNNGYKNILVKEINLNLEYIKQLDYGYRIGSDIKKIETDQTNLYVLMKYLDYNTDKEITVLNVIDHNLCYVSQYIYKYDNYNYTKPIDIVINDSNIVSVLLQFTNKNYIVGYGVIKLKDNKEILNIVNFNNEYPDKFKDKNGNHIYTSINNQIKKVLINSVIVFNFGENEIKTHEEIYNYEVYVNSSLVKHNDKKSKISYDLDIFGNYNLIYYFETKDVDFIYNKNCYIKEDVNIQNSQIYDLEFRIYFNGVGYLNGELIESGYKIQMNGKYTLDLIGKDSLQRKYTFFIEDNSVKNIILNDLSEITIEKENTSITDKNVQIDINQTPLITDRSTTETNYLMLIPVIIFSAALVCLFKIK